MISGFENLSIGGSNTTGNHGDPFSHTGKCWYTFACCVELVFQSLLDLNDCEDSNYLDVVMM